MRVLIVRLVATFFGIGYIPWAPGTAASLATALLVYCLPELSLVLGLTIVGTLFITGCIVSHRFEQQVGIPDPSSIVIDEVCGMWLVLLCTPKTIMWYTIAFGLFRFFDIYKPFPIDIPEKLMKGGVGIMLDDILAALASGVILFYLVF